MTVKWYLYEWWQISDTYEWWQIFFICMSDDRKNIHVWVMTEKLYMFEWWQKNYKCMKYVFRVCAEREQGGDHPHGHHWFTLAKVCAAFLHVVLFLFFSLFAPVKKHLYCSLLGWSNDFWHSVLYSWSTQRLNNGNINLPLNASFWAFPCYLKQDGQSVWWSLLVFLCCLKQDGQSVWWSLLVFLWFCPRQELKWSVTYVSETDFVFCVGYRLSAKPVFTSLECPSEIISIPDVKGECVRRMAGSRWLWCQMELVLTVTLMWNGMGVDSDFVKWNGWWQWL